LKNTKEEGINENKKDTFNYNFVMLCACVL